MSNNITSINSLINKQEGDDEDRKFLRAAAEAIVATSMNSKIDPTILELLKRIQYASNPNNGKQGIKTPSAGFDGASNSNDFLNVGLTNPALNPNHFPTLNLNYFDSMNNESNNSSTTNNSNNGSSAAGTSNSQWNFQSPSILSGNSPLYHNNNSNRDVSSPNSLVSTPPNSTISHTLSSRHDHERQGSINLDSDQHSSEKPFVCNDCTLSFRRSSDLRRHQRAHLPILPHICQLCGKGFARKDALKRHSDTLTCKRNRERLLSSGGDLDGILARSTK